ncbi:MAG: DUF459 domain-containing protein [Myxococcota bacterium]
MDVRRAPILLAAPLFLGLSFLCEEAAARDWRAPDPWPAGRPRVLVIGDSNIYGPMGDVLQQAMVDSGYVVWRRGIPSTGLSRQDRFDWMANARAMIDEFHPDVVVAEFGGNDVLQVNWRTEPRRPVPFKREADWRAAYRERVRGFLTLLAGDSRKVFLLSPTNRGVGADRVARVREEQRNGAQGVPRVTFVDMFPLTSDERGRWLWAAPDAHGKKVVIRRGDTIHLNDEGAVIIGGRVLDTLARSGLALRWTPRP